MLPQAKAKKEKGAVGGEAKGADGKLDVPPQPTSILNNLLLIFLSILVEKK